MALNYLYVTNTVDSPAYPYTGVRVTINLNVAADKEAIGWFYEGMKVECESYKGTVTSVDRKGSTFVVMPDEKIFCGTNLYVLSAGSQIKFYENKIGNQVWQIQPAIHTVMRDGTEIELIDPGKWSQEFYTKPRYDYQFNDPAKLDYGLLYNYYTYMNPNFCPSGWRIPRSWDIDKLIAALNGYVENLDGYDWFVGMGKLKSISGWGYGFPNYYAENYKHFNERQDCFLRDDGQLSITANSGNTLVYPSYIASVDLPEWFGLSSIASVTPCIWNFYSDATYSNATWWYTMYGGPICSPKIRMVKDYNPNGGIN